MNSESAGGSATASIVTELVENNTRTWITLQILDLHDKTSQSADIPRTGNRAWNQGHWFLVFFFQSGRVFPSGFPFCLTAVTRWVILASRREQHLDCLTSLLSSE